MNKLANLLQAVFAVIIDEARENARFAARLESALTDLQQLRTRKAHRRTKASIDPFELFDIGEDQLRTALAKLDLEQLKDVVAGYGMDRSRLALKWKSSERLTELIVDTVKARVRKGDAFRHLPTPES